MTTRIAEEFTDCCTSERCKIYYEKYKISSAQLVGLGNAIADAFNANVGDINADKDEIKQELDNYEVSNTFPNIKVNTLVWFDCASEGYEGTKDNFEGTQPEITTFNIKKVYTTIADNKDSSPVNNYMVGVARFFDQTELN